VRLGCAVRVESTGQDSTTSPYLAGRVGPEHPL
jgi:hypothetical protein